MTADIHKAVKQVGLTPTDDLHAMLAELREARPRTRRTPLEAWRQRAILFINRALAEEV